MSYYMKFSEKCFPITPALTSNQKFILPNNKIYCDCLNPMIIYPGNEFMIPYSDPNKSLKVYNENCSTCKLN